MKRKCRDSERVRRAACLLPAVLACAFAGAGQAQTLYKEGLDYAVGKLTLELVEGANLRGKRVLVESDDFFELGTGLRLGLSDKLRGLSASHLTDYGVDVALSGSDADAVRVLHGRWQRESETELYLELFVAEPVKSGDPTALRSAKGRVPIDEGIQELIESTPDDWGRLLVRKLERGVRDQRERSVHLQPMTLSGGDEGQGDELKGFLEDWLGGALVESRLFTLVEPPPGVTVETDGELYVEAKLRADTLDVSLRVLDNAHRRVTFAKVAVDRSLLPGLRADAGFPSGKRFRDCGMCPEMVVVPEGSFMMGSPSGEAGRTGNEGPVHPVTMARPFAVGVYEVTFGEWDACVSDGGCGGYRPGDSGWGRGPRPVINVSWEDAQAYVRWLSGETGKAYRLLSEAEWEYVARAGTTGPYHFGSSLSPSQANYEENRGGTVPVGSYSANEFGLHDVHGNVWEWVEDCWNESYHGAPRDGSAWESGDCSRRVLRGGSWYVTPRLLRSAIRSWGPTGFRNDDAGFRVARTLTP